MVFDQGQGSQNNRDDLSLSNNGISSNLAERFEVACTIADVAGYKDHLGMFAVSCFGCDALVKKFEADNDDYSKIMAQALSDRFVEAFADYLH